MVGMRLPHLVQCQNPDFIPVYGGRSKGAFRLTWGPRNGPHTPTRSERPGKAVAPLDIRHHADAATLPSPSAPSAVSRGSSESTLSSGFSASPAGVSTSTRV